ncbi:MAG: tetratricopeptide repeat protein [Acidobacteriia bacterium]|nr:tetratricopeptide repeat protein [Terriglobia bacterium]
MQSYTRRQLKEDKFAETAQGAMKWASGHQQGTLWTILAIVAVAALTIGLYFWHESQTEKANLALGKAIRTFEARLRAPGTPPGDDLSFTSMAERGKQAEKEFTAVADSYSFTKAGKIARYMAATAALQSGDTASAEKQLKAVADSSSDAAPLAKMALATLYRSTNRDGEAAKLYKDMIDHPTGTVSKAQAQFALAEMYESSDPKQAETIYKQIQSENKDTAIGQMAAGKLNPRGQQ